MIKFVLKVYGKIGYLKRKISLYYYNHSLKDTANINNVSYAYREINNLSGMLELKIKYNLEDYTNRLLNNNIFCFWEEQAGVPISYGWINPTGKHNLGELDLIMNLGDKIDVLYDFYTFEPFRGKGLYPALLQKICQRNTKAKLIYAFSNNLNSIRGIEKANFKLLVNLYGFSKNRYSKFISKIWSE